MGFFQQFFHLLFNLCVNDSAALHKLSWYTVYSLDFVGQVVLIVSPPLHQECRKEKEEQDEANHGAHCGTHNHSHIGGWESWDTQRLCFIKHIVNIVHNILLNWISEMYICHKISLKTNRSLSLSKLGLLCAAYRLRYPGWWCSFLIQLRWWLCTHTFPTCYCSGCSASNCQSSHLKVHRTEMTDVRACMPTNDSMTTQTQPGKTSNCFNIRLNNVNITQF